MESFVENNDPVQKTAQWYTFNVDIKMYLWFMHIHVETDALEIEHNEQFYTHRKFVITNKKNALITMQSN